MENERLRILTMLREGRLTPEQADELLQALEACRPPEPPAAPERPSVPERPPGPGRGFLPDLGATVAQTVAKALSGQRGRANYGRLKLTSGRLARMPDASEYDNYGHLVLAADITPDLLRQKIARFTNYGYVDGPEQLLEVLLDVCEENYGAFGGPDEAEPESAPAP